MDAAAAFTSSAATSAAATIFTKTLEFFHSELNRNYDGFVFKQFEIFTRLLLLPLEQLLLLLLLLLVPLLLLLLLLSAAMVVTMKTAAKTRTAEEATAKTAAYASFTIRI